MNEEALTRVKNLMKRTPACRYRRCDISHWDYRGKWLPAGKPLLIPEDMSADAVGHAGGTRWFHRQGFAIVRPNYDFMVSARYGNLWWWDAICSFFDMEEDHLRYMLFEPESPQVVINRITEHLGAVKGKEFIHA